MNQGRSNLRANFLKRFSTLVSSLAAFGIVGPTIAKASCEPSAATFNGRCYGAGQMIDDGSHCGVMIYTSSYAGGVVIEVLGSDNND